MTLWVMFILLEEKKSSAMSKRFRLCIQNNTNKNLRIKKSGKDRINLIAHPRTSSDHCILFAAGSERCGGTERTLDLGLPGNSRKNRF